MLPANVQPFLGNVIAVKLLHSIASAIASCNVCCDAGSDSIHVWDLYSGLELHIFRPLDSVSITTLAASNVHGRQVSN